VVTPIRNFQSFLIEHATTFPTSLSFQDSRRQNFVSKARIRETGCSELFGGISASVTSQMPSTM
jgi:hypothetical protein